LEEAADLATITVYGGDFKAGKGSYASKQFIFITGIFSAERVPLDRLATLETVSLENNGRDTGSTVGRALVGELLAGPFGAIIAAGTAKARNQVTFLATFDDNRQFLGATDSETFKTWMGTLLTRRRMEENETARAAATIKTTELPQAPKPRRHMGGAIMAAILFVTSFAIVSGNKSKPAVQPTQVVQTAAPFVSDGCDLAGAVANCKEIVRETVAKQIKSTGRPMNAAPEEPAAHDPRMDAAWAEVQRSIAESQRRSDLADQEVRNANARVDLAKKELEFVNRYGRAPRY
jgi:hypothetical protein